MITYSKCDTIRYLNLAEIPRILACLLVSLQEHSCIHLLFPQIIRSYYCLSFSECIDLILCLFVLIDCEWIHCEVMNGQYLRLRAVEKPKPGT